MSLKNAALFALIGMIVLTALLAVDFIDATLAVGRGLVPAMKLLTSFVDLLASVGLTVFLYVFQRTQRCARSFGANNKLTDRPSIPPACRAIWARAACRLPAQSHSRRTVFHAVPPERQLRRPVIAFRLRYACAYARRAFGAAPGGSPGPGGPVHEPDSHVRTQWCQSVRLSDRAATAREGAEAKPVGVDALELPRNPGAACHACSRVIGTSLENSRKTGLGRSEFA